MKKDNFKIKRANYVATHMVKHLPENFCSAPFTQIFIYPTGDVFACCEGAGPLGNLKKNTLDEIWNGPVIKKLREEFLSGNPIQCKKNIACKGCNRYYDEQLIYGDFKVHQVEPPKALEVILNGKCNIDCIMCEVKNQIQSVPQLEGYRQEIEKKVYPSLKQISVKSGEPFVQKETFDMIEAVSRVNADCVWRFTTNGQYHFNEALKKRLEKIKIDQITFSIDSIDKNIFEEIREKGSLDKLNRAVADIQAWEKLKEQDFSIEFAVNITLQKKNCFNVPETYKYYFQKGMTPYLIFVEKPEEYSLLTLSVGEITEILLYYLNLPKEYDSHFLIFYKALSPIFDHFNQVMISKLKILFENKAIELHKKYKEICSLPFTQISIFPDGSLKPCCWLYDYDLREGKPGDFDAAWNGAPMKKLREEFLSDNVVACKEKIDKVACNTKHPKFNKLISYEVVQRGPLPVLHWYYNGKCNLQCQTCNNWKITEEFPDSEVYWESLQKTVLPYLCEIEVVGGEPFFQNRTYKLISTASKLNPLCVWTITSNGQFSFKGKIEDHLKMIRLVHFSVSIDSLIPERFSKIRINGVLSKTLKFLEDLIAYRNEQSLGKRFDLTINFVLQKDNWDELERMLEFAKEKDAHLYVIPMLEPTQHSIYSFPMSEKEKLLSTLDELAKKYNHENIIDLRLSLFKDISRHAEQNPPGENDVLYR